MNARNLIKRKIPLQLLQNSFKVIFYAVARVVQMACVQAQTELVVVYDAVIDTRQLLEGLSDLAALAGHRLKSDVSLRIGVKGLIEASNDLHDTGVLALSDMRSRMKHQCSSAHRCSSL